MASRLCLNMIVRNEEAILDRCLRSHIGVIDCFVIHDTGSTDGTIDVIERFSRETGIDGIVTHGVFEDFSQARNEALEAARASGLEFDHILLADADMELCVTDPAWRDAVTGSAHHVLQRAADGSLEYPNTRIVSRQNECRYVGLTHEYIDAGAIDSLVTGAYYLDHACGSNRAEKYERDIRLLERAIARDPEDSRAWFYLGNSLLETQRHEEAIAAYQRRLTFEFYPDERFMSAYRIGMCIDALGDHAAAFRHMLEVFDNHPTRAEPLHWCALQAQRSGHHRVAYMLATQGREISKPVGGLFVDSSVYEWRLDDIVSVSLFWMGDYAASVELCEALLPVVPESERPRIEANIAFGRERLASTS